MSYEPPSLDLMSSLSKEIVDKCEEKYWTPSKGGDAVTQYPNCLLGIDFAVPGSTDKLANYTVKILKDRNGSLVNYKFVAEALEFSLKMREEINDLLKHSQDLGMDLQTGSTVSAGSPHCEFRMKDLEEFQNLEWHGRNPFELMAEAKGFSLRAGDWCVIPASFTDFFPGTESDTRHPQVKQLQFSPEPTCREEVKIYFLKSLAYKSSLGSYRPPHWRKPAIEFFCLKDSVDMMKEQYPGQEFEVGVVISENDNTMGRTDEFYTVGDLIKKIAEESNVDCSVYQSALIHLQVNSACYPEKYKVDSTLADERLKNLKYSIECSPLLKVSPQGVGLMVQQLTQ